MRAVKRSDLRCLFLTVSEVESFCVHCGLYLIRVIRRVPRLMSMIYARFVRIVGSRDKKRPRVLRDDCVQQNARSALLCSTQYARADIIKDADLY